MLVRAGLVALTILVGCVTFVLSAAVLWPIAAILGQGAPGAAAALAASAVLGAAAGIWVGLMAAQSAGETTPH